MAAAALMLDNLPILRTIARNRGMLFPASAAALMFVILIPLPTPALDTLLTVNILLTAVVLMTVMYIRAPLEFSSFPSLLLAMTLFRLVLNVATTRVILSHGADGPGAAGHVVEAFGQFVAANSLAVGVIIFLIITVIQFVVITKGATRVAEVAARFTLDGMPGKQMAIDADLNAGIIDEGEARRRRTEVSREADFYGAMDGASKFVRGDAIAGIIITFVNILGGLYVGMVESGLPLAQCLKLYTTLTIGDGLASQIPAFMISIGAGMLVTRSSSHQSMGEDVLGQLFAKPVALMLAAAFLCVLALTPLPKLPLLSLAAGSAFLAFTLNRSQTVEAQRRVTEAAVKEHAKAPPIETQLSVDPLELQVGVGLVRLIDKARGGDMLDRISGIRKQLAAELGIIVPAVRIRDNAALQPNAYSILLRGQEVARGEVFPDEVLAIDSGVSSEPLRGHEVREPTFGMRAWWLDRSLREHAERLNYTVVEPSGVLATHLTELVKRHAPDLLTRQDTQKLIDALKSRNQGLVDEVIPALLKVGEVQKVLQNLLRERVPIRDLETILETLGDWSPRTKDAEVLTEYVRNALGRTISSQYKDHANAIHAVTIDPATEDFIQGNIQRSEVGSSISIPPDRQAEFALRVRRQVESAAPAAAGAAIAILCSPQVRLWVRRLVEPLLPQTPVLSMNEVIRGVDVKAHGVVSLER
jgi:flagellar biosynthesis protein FlhA